MFAKYDGVSGLMTKDQFINTLRNQELLNVVYSGKEWRENIPLFKFILAADAEWAEFLTETEDKWRWWKQDANADHDKAVFEFIDTIHFMMASLLHKWTPDELESFIEKYPMKIVGLQRVGEGKRLERAIRARAAFALHLYNGSPLDSIEDLCMFIGTVAEMLGLNNIQVHRAYLLKNERNRQRVAGGVLRGEYDKSTESTLTL